MRGSRALASVVAALLLATGLGACGDGGSDETSSATGAAQQSGRSGSGGEELARGGEASIEDFGAEAGSGDRRAILAAFESYLDAIASEDYATACSHLSATVQQSLEQLVPQQLKAQGCAAILPRLLAPTAPAVARQQANGAVTKVRVEGDRAFVVFKAPGAKLYQLTMIREDGKWKATLVAASVLVPEL